MGKYIVRRYKTQGFYKDKINIKELNSNAKLLSIEISTLNATSPKRERDKSRHRRTERCIFPIRENAGLERARGSCVAEVKYLREDGEAGEYISDMSAFRCTFATICSISIFFLLLSLSPTNSHVSVRLFTARRNRVEKQRSSGGQIFSRENLSHRKQPSSTTRK